MKSFGPKKFQIPCTDQKVPFWQFFRKGRDGRALIVRPSRIPHRNSKILFALGADEFLVMLEGKIREAPFFKGSIWQNNSVLVLLSSMVPIITTSVRLQRQRAIASWAEVTLTNNHSRHLHLQLQSLSKKLLIARRAM